MNNLSLKLQKLRESQRFLSKDIKNIRRFKFCCCDDDEEIHGQQQYASIFSNSPSPKISIKKMKRPSQKGLNHSNSQFSISKQSNHSNIYSKKASPSHINSPSCNESISNIVHSTLAPQPSNITFVYSNKTNQNKNIIHKNYTNGYIPSEPVIQMFPAHLPSRHYKSYTKMPVKPKIIDQNIQKQFKNILDFGDTVKEQYSCGEPFQMENEEDYTKLKAPPNMPNFSFGQNQKQQFMSKYLSVKNEISQEKLAINSKSNSNKSEMIKQIIEERLSKHSKSSRSSGQVFVRGTFNKNTLNSLAKKRDLLYQYKSQSDISLESSQSLVIETYQSIMKKRESFIGDYQY